MSGLRIILFHLCFLPAIAISAQSSILVETQWLANKLGQKQIALIDMSDSMQYSRFHIPGARHLPYNAINQFNRKRVSLSIGSQNISRLLGELGVSPDMHIVIYDDVGGLNAARLFWELERIGHQKVSLLNGGLVKWILEGRKVVASHAQYPKTRYTQRQAGSPDKLATLHDIKLSDRSSPTLLDVRSQDEYRGHPRQKNSGHIRGAKWWQWEDNVNFENAFLFKTDQQLLSRANELGLKNRDHEIIVYCQSGHRAAHSYFTLRKLGFTNIRLYDGSMAEFTQQRPADIQKGDRP